MAQDKYYGAVLLTRGCEKIALVKPNGCPVWCFPMGEVSNQSDKEATISVVEKQTGIHIRGNLGDEFLEAEFPSNSGRQTRLYVVHSLAERNLAPAADSAIDDAQWLPLSQILEFPSETSSEEQPVMPFVPLIKDYINRRHELREANPNFELGKLLVYSTERWRGIKPREVLMQFLGENLLPAPHFNTFEPPCAQPPLPVEICERRKCASCTLPHLGVQITPEVSYADEPSAIENAALTALVFLEGGYDTKSKGVDIRFVGFFPGVTSVWNEQDGFFGTISREGKFLSGGGSWWHKNSAVLDPSAPVSKRSKKAKAPKPGQQPVTKNAIQVLKELCDRERWMQPTYDYERAPSGQVVCTVSLANAGVEGLAGLPQLQQKQAKLEAATACLVELRNRGLYV